VALERLVSRLPFRVRDRTVDAGGDDVAPSPSPSSLPPTVEVACWTPVGAEPGDRGAPADPPEPRATLLAEPAFLDATPVSHTLVLEVDAPTRSVAVDYRPFDASVIPRRGVRVRTDDGDRLAVDDAGVADGGTFVVTLAKPRTDGALFVTYDVTRNPPGGRHAVGVVVDDIRETEARLVTVGR